MGDTVDGRNPAPPGMYKTYKNPVNNGINYTLTNWCRISSINRIISWLVGNVATSKFSSLEVNPVWNIHLIQ